MSSPKTSIIWFRRDLRINDHPALLAAIELSDQVIPLFILDKQQIKEAGSKLLAYMGQSLRYLDESHAYGERRVNFTLPDLDSNQEPVD
jgi:deoxyribodipyrimidine photo-lyase